MEPMTTTSVPIRLKANSFNMTSRYHSESSSNKVFYPGEPSSKFPLNESLAVCTLTPVEPEACLPDCLWTTSFIRISITMNQAAQSCNDLSSVHPNHNELRIPTRTLPIGQARRAYLAHRLNHSYLLITPVMHT